MIKVGRSLLGHRGQDTQAHQDVALGIEQHDLLVGPRQCQAEAKAGMPAHRRVAELDVELLVVAEVDPIAAAAARDQDRIAAVAGEGLHHLGSVHHLGPPPLYRLKPWYSSPTRTTTGRLVRSASSKATAIRDESAS